MKCDDARHYLTELKKSYQVEKHKQALEHVLRCDSCLQWSLQQAEELRKAKT
jgi:hypothetical protein